MIKEKELQELRPQLQCKNGQDITLWRIQSTLQEYASKHDIAAAFYTEQVKSGGLIGRTEDCLVVYHPEHQKDYFSIVIRVKYEGDTVLITADSFGMSKLMKAEAVRKQIKDTAKLGMQRAADLHKDYNILNDVATGGILVAGGISTAKQLIVGKSEKEKLEREKQWYIAICNLLDKIDP